MSLRLEMLQVARLAPKLLGDSTDLVADFLRSQHHSGGGFCDREGKPDLYYSTFGIAGYMALQMPLPVDALAGYLRSEHHRIAELNLIDLSCLARCWAFLPRDLWPADLREKTIFRMEHFRAADGGFFTDPSESHGSLYGCYVAMGLAQDIGYQLGSEPEMLECIRGRLSQDGGYSNSPDLPFGLVPTTAAAASLFRHLGSNEGNSVRDWLLSQMHQDGGFCVGSGIVMPDLLSTATALHALSTTSFDLGLIAEKNLDYLDTLWTARGGFVGSWEDDALDIEYTYYGLLSLGHLSFW
ncbi:MAG: prenyltransferase/squalene oxidase repeat-containing protein [Planctomycetota bacterium]